MTEANSTHSFATIGAVYEDGVTLIFEGETEPGPKHYLVNTSVVFAAGDRVKLAADSGTYIVEYVVGAPKAAESEGILGLPTGGIKGQVLTKQSSTDGDAAWASSLALPTGGTKGQVLIKQSNYIDGDADWSDEVRGNAVRNQYNSTTLDSDRYDIYFRTKSASTSGTPVFQIRFGPSGTWYTLTTTT